MKKYIAKAGLFFMILAWVCGWLPGAETNVAKAAYTGMEGGTITVREAAVGDLLCGYKLIDVSYDAVRHETDYAWTAGIEELIAEANGGDILSVVEFVGLTQSERLAILKTLRAQIVKTPELPSVKVDDLGTAEWQDVPLGGYMIIPENTAEVYQIMFVILQPAYDEAANDYRTEPAVFFAKKVPVKLVKEVDTVTTGQTHTVEYNVTADLPTYSQYAVDKYFGMSDKTDKGIDIDDDSIRVYGYASREDADEGIGATELGTLTECSIDGLYTPCEKLSGQKVAQDFALEFDYDKIPAGIHVIKIVYDARINESAMIGGGGNLNVAEMEYTTNPFVVTGSGEYHNFLTDEKEIYTYQLQIIKVDADDETARLSGAEFDLYRRADENETEPVVTHADIPQLGDGRYVLVAHMGPTGEDGIAGAKVLDLEPYYLVETKAPDGYRLPDQAVEIVLSLENGLDTEIGALTAVIENVKEDLPVVDPPVVDPPKEEPKEPSKAEPPKEPSRQDPPKVEGPKTTDYKVIFFVVIGATLTAGTIIFAITKTENESQR